LGSLVVDGLSRSGIRRYLLCDNDVFNPCNLARHSLLSHSLFYLKAAALSVHLRTRIPDVEVKIEAHDVRTPRARLALKQFSPDLVVLATGDTNTDITVSEIAAREGWGPCCFTWVEPNLESGHLIIQPQGGASILRQLHSVEGIEGRYCHATVDSPESVEMRESGCQSSYTPYSGLDMVQFAAQVSRKIISWLVAPPSSAEILRIKLADSNPWEKLL